MKNNFIATFVATGTILLTGCGTGTDSSDSGTPPQIERDNRFTILHIPKDLCESQSFQTSIIATIPSTRDQIFVSENVEGAGCGGIINDQCSYGPYYGFQMPNAKDSENMDCRISYNGTIDDKDLIYSEADDQLAIYYSK